MTEMTTPTLSTQRLHGLDLARYLALIGMVIVNFNVVMVPTLKGTKTSLDSSYLLQGRAAATFVVLAGIGLGLSAARKPWRNTMAITVRRAAFLLVIGLLNMTIFGADIIHYYAFYFLFAVCFLQMRSRNIVAVMALLVFGFVGLILTFEYNTGWNWATFAYTDIWTPRGFFRSLFFNGWHPIVPWLAFVLLGLLISRLRLSERRVQIRLFSIGVVNFALAELTSIGLMSVVDSPDPEADLLFSTTPIPPFPLYMIAGSSAACAVIDLCLLLEPWLDRTGMLGLFTPAGRQTLTLYIAHILIGMGTLEAIGLLGNSTPANALWAAFGFCILATLFAAIWTRYFERGLIESLMRKVAG
jgi:uncharacterized membrane protein YeiB